MLISREGFNNYENGGDDERNSPVSFVKGNGVAQVAQGAFEQLAPNEPLLNNNVTVIEVEDKFYDALTGDEESDQKIAKTGIEATKQKVATSITSVVKDVALRIYSYVGGVLVSLYSFNDSIRNKLHPKARNPETKTDHLVDKIARESLPKALPRIILNALDFIDLKGFMSRHKHAKGLYEMVSLFALEFIVNRANDVVTIGLDRFVKSTEGIVNRTIEQKNDILKLAEALVLNNTAKTLGSMNEVYASDKDLQSKSQAEQTVAVLTHLKAKGELHEAVALLSLEEETLWSARDTYLAPGQTVHDRILALSDDKEANAREIEALYELKAIELKITTAEYAYLTKLGNELFERILYPNNSFKDELPIYLRPFAGWIKDKVLLGFSATLSSAIKSTTNPERIVKMVIEEHQKKQVLANLNKYLLTHESVDAAIERYKDGNPIVLMALKDLKAAADKQTDVAVTSGDNYLTGAVLHKLAKEVGRVGYSGTTEAVEFVEFCGNVTHAVASGAMGVLEWGLGWFESAATYVGGSYGETAKEYAKGAKENVQAAKKTWDTRYDPNTAIANAIGDQVAGLHQRGLNVFNQDGLNDALGLLPDLIEGAAVLDEAPETHPATLVEQRESEKATAKAILKLNITNQFGTIVGDTMASGIDPMVDRFSNKRLNLALTYSAIDGAIEALRAAAGDKK